jgi:hypothetical protein
MGNQFANAYEKPKVVLQQPKAKDSGAKMRFIDND